MNKKIVVTSGYFDPIHVGHIECLEKAKQLGDKLIVIVNNDNQAILKKGKPFMSEEDRCLIVSKLKMVDEVFLSIDQDRSVCKSIEHLTPNINIFAKGGDRSSGEIPESDICEKHDIQIIDGLGDKIRSSSEFINNLKK